MMKMQDLSARVTVLYIYTLQILRLSLLLVVVLFKTIMTDLISGNDHKKSFVKVRFLNYNVIKQKRK